MVSKIRLSDEGKHTNKTKKFSDEKNGEKYEKWNGKGKCGTPQNLYGR